MCDQGAHTDRWSSLDPAKNSSAPAEHRRTPQGQLRGLVDSGRSVFPTEVGRGSSVSSAPRVRLTAQPSYSPPRASTSSQHLRHPRPPGPTAAQTLPINLMLYRQRAEARHDVPIRLSSPLSCHRPQRSPKARTLRPPAPPAPLPLMPRCPALPLSSTLPWKQTAHPATHPGRTRAGSPSTVSSAAVPRSLSLGSHGFQVGSTWNNEAPPTPAPCNHHGDHPQGKAPSEVKVQRPQTLQLQGVSQGFNSPCDLRRRGCATMRRAALARQVC